MANKHTAFAKRRSVTLTFAPMPAPHDNQSYVECGICGHREINRARVLRHIRAKHTLVQDQKDLFE